MTVIRHPRAQTSPEVAISTVASRGGRAVRQMSQRASGDRRSDGQHRDRATLHILKHNNVSSLRASSVLKQKNRKSRKAT
ncbi:hypothetical protein EVAR_84404_1 [Eumeta japonica]|uniref:Uncharacterized protein n=1 Tax=Eumeta variegata TaxID=151549 RepID=A0A4C1YHQ9_EUMVA|nr:hypothetical protein EVAR_84404_1 [Eumeta japonica]